MAKLKWYPVLCWLFILLGPLVPSEPQWLRILWWLNAILTPGLHILELYWSIPLGRKAGYSLGASIFMTLLLGATWWKPLQTSLKN